VPDAGDGTVNVAVTDLEGAAASERLAGEIERHTQARVATVARVIELTPLGSNISSASTMPVSFDALDVKHLI